MTVIIPARYASTRFPGKPLALLNGKPIVQHVFERAAEAVGVNKVFVATDSSKIYETVTGFGGNAIMTSESCANGTERCREAYINASLTDPIVINVQGDEPLITPEQILSLARLLENRENDIATLVRKPEEGDDVFDPSIVKVVTSLTGRALYFSRSPIPFVRDVDKDQWMEKAQYLLHVGMYGFQAEVLQKIALLPPSPLELAEKLEQLRWLQNGYSIATALTQHRSVGIDTPEDLVQAQRVLSK